MNLYTYNTKTLKYRKANFIKLLFYILCGLLVFMIVSITIIKVKDTLIYNTETQIESPIIVIEKDTNTFSKENLIAYIDNINIKFPKIVYAQACIETGYFTSSIFKENNNLFGMKCARSRCYTHQGPFRGHAKYENWKMSVIDYALYQSAYLRKLNTEAQYYQYISENYAQDPNYINKVKSIVAKL